MLKCSYDESGGCKLQGGGKSRFGGGYHLGIKSVLQVSCQKSDNRVSRSESE